MHPQVLKVLAGVITMALSIIFERSWWSKEGPQDRKKSNVIPISKKGKEKGLGSFRVVNHSSIPDGVDNPGNYF